VLPCPDCGEPMEDLGTPQDQADPYAPYFPDALETSGAACTHYFWCEDCQQGATVWC